MVIEPVNFLNEMSNHVGEVSLALAIASEPSKVVATDQLNHGVAVETLVSDPETGMISFTQKKDVAF